MNQNIEVRINNFIIEKIEPYCRNNEINLNDDITSIGIQSINYIKLVIMIEEEFDFEFDDEMLDHNKVKTLRSLVEYVKEKQKMV